MIRTETRTAGRLVATDKLGVCLRCPCGATRYIPADVREQDRYGLVGSVKSFEILHKECA